MDHKRIQKYTKIINKGMNFLPIFQIVIVSQTWLSNNKNQMGVRENTGIMNYSKKRSSHIILVNFT